MIGVPQSPRPRRREVPQAGPSIAEACAARGWDPRTRSRDELFALRASLLGHGGGGVCTWCHSEVTGRRRHWCGDACVREYRMWFHWPTIRRAVLKRDRAICRTCGFDARAAQAERRRLLAEHVVPKRVTKSLAEKRRIAEARLERKLALLEFAALHRVPIGRASADWWDADHIVPRIEGGTNALDNLRTLCLRCHGVETAKLRERRSALRAAAVEAPARVRRRAGNVAGAVGQARSSKRA